MSWAVGFDETWQRDIGYGVPAYCDHPGCMAEIDRGLSYVCGGEPVEIGQAWQGDDGKEVAEDICDLMNMAYNAGLEAKPGADHD